MKDPCVYILASSNNGTLYVGVTSDLYGRMSEHSQGLFQGFTKKYAVTNLVWYCYHDTMIEAIGRGKQLKNWQRKWKIRLIEEMNPSWRNLYDVNTGEIKIGSIETAQLNE